jgi:hypothetical protein
MSMLVASSACFSMNVAARLDLGPHQDREDLVRLDAGR